MAVVVVVWYGPLTRLALQNAIAFLSREKSNPLVLPLFHSAALQLLGLKAEPLARPAPALLLFPCLVFGAAMLGSWSHGNHQVGPRTAIFLVAFLVERR